MAQPRRRPALRVKPKPVTRFEKRVWQDCPLNWRWELRRVTPVVRSRPAWTQEVSESLASGWASGPADANRQIAQHIATIEKREGAKWVTIK